MGIFDFIKDAGAKLFGVSEAKAADADALKKAVEATGLKADGLNIKVDGDKVTVSGKAASTEDAEKIILAVGNTIGVAKVDSQMTATAVAVEATMYTVKKGDTLWKIAEQHYGKGKGDKYKDIVKANTPPVKNPDLIQPGWVLRIPPQ